MGADPVPGRIATVDLRGSAAEPQGLDESLTEVALDGRDQESQRVETFQGILHGMNVLEQLRGHRSRGDLGKNVTSM